ADADRRDMRGTGEGGCDRFRIAELDGKAQIVLGLVPDPGRARRERSLDRGHRRQRLVGDVDQLGRVLRLARRFGEDEGDTVVDIAAFAGDEAKILDAADPVADGDSRHAPRDLSLASLTGCLQQPDAPAKGRRSEGGRWPWRSR